MTPARLADELGCTHRTIGDYTNELRHPQRPKHPRPGRPPGSRDIHLTPTEVRVIRAWHHLTQPHHPAYPFRSRRHTIRTLRNNARHAIENDPTDAPWLLLDLDSARTTHAPLTAAAHYHNPNRHPTRAL